MVRTILSPIRFSPLRSPIPLIDGLPPRTCVHLVPLLPLISQRGLALSQALCILLRTLVEMAGQSQPRIIALTGFDAAATDARMLQSPTERCLKTQGSTDAESPSHTPYSVLVCMMFASMTLLPATNHRPYWGSLVLAVEVGNTDQIIQMA